MSLRTEYIQYQQEVLYQRDIGRREQAEETAKAMLKDKMDTSLIMKYTGLNEQQINNIAKEAQAED